jgi:hypothetical protein
LSFMRGAAELTVKKAPLRLVWTIFSKMGFRQHPCENLR